MKVAIYIEQGVTQLVLTPESAWEKDVCKKVTPDGQHQLTIHRGGFYECQGGWFREGRTEDSLILRVDPLPRVPEEAQFQNFDPAPSVIQGDSRP